MRAGSAGWLGRTAFGPSTRPFGFPHQRIRIDAYCAANGDEFGQVEDAASILVRRHQRFLQPESFSQFGLRKPGLAAGVDEKRERGFIMGIK